jgi:NAD(P)-dependent dehydrogenase (short-subunit alcohol dehydrogenase family)
VVITGSSAGIGKETARDLASRNATIIFACRDQSKTNTVINELLNQSRNPNLVFMKLNLSDSDSIREFSEEFHKKYDRLNILINNAGIGNTELVLDKEGHELNFKTNHLGHFLLTHLLLDLMVATPKGRIINVSSELHR